MGLRWAQAACMQSALERGLGTRGAHVEHALHGCDAGRVKTQRLVERRRVLPSRKEGIQCGARYEVRARRREGVRWRLNKQRLKQGPT